MKKLVKYSTIFLSLIVSTTVKAQCTLNLFANPDPVLCGECVTLTAIGSMNGNVAFQEDFNSGSPVGWQFTQATTIANNTCLVPSPDGTDFMWMGNASVNPRDMTTVGFDLTLGGTICFEMRYSIQGNVDDTSNASSCEGPDEPDEGVYLQYSNNGGATWNTIQYWDPNGGNDPSLTGWNQYCVTIPAGAMTANTMIQWHQNAVSGAEYDHWGIDNVIITLNDPNSQISWLHDSYAYPLGSGGGADPTQVCMSVPTTYTAQITNGVNTCTKSITVNVVNPVVSVNAGADASICPGDCAQLTGEAKVVTSPASTPTFENNEISLVTSGSADMNINVTGLNQTTLTSSSITEVCLNGFNFSGTQFCSSFGGCNCNGTPISFGSTCNLNISSFDVILTTPNGCQITLVPAGVASGTNYSNVCFVPSGGPLITSGGFPSTGTWNPSQPFSNLNGCSSNGVWNLQVNAPGGLGFGVGSLSGWSISFDDPEISYPASYTWSPTTAMTNSTTLTPTVCPAATQTYTLQATDANHCVVASDDVVITVAPCVNCSISALTATPSACAPATNTYTDTGSITFTNAPTTGTLTVTSSCGGSQTFTSPFTSPQAYSISGITSNGALCNVTAVFSADLACTMTTNYTAPAACTPNCLISNFTATQGACESPLNVFDITGEVTFSNAPASGMLTVTSCDGSNQVFNAPFTSPQAYTLNNLPADGATCNVTAVFSADAACTQTINFTNPGPCDVPCAFTSIADTIGACDLVTNDFIRSGKVTFANAPSTGTLTLTDCLGNTQTFNPPFTSPTSYSLTINSNGTANCDITATFSADTTCTINIAQSYPASCACPADAGTSSAGVFGNGLNDYILCSGDTIIIVSDGNETNPNDVGVIGTSTYDPGITYGIYSCPPTANTNPELDACFTGFVTGTIGNYGDINDGGLITFLNGQGVTLTNNIIYYAPITLYNQNDLVYNVNCVDVGLPIAVQYLPQVVSSNPTENCAAGTFTVTINGGLPQLDGSNFTSSNLVPATASFVNTTATNGGTIQITGLQNGDNYSFDVADVNGCPVTITGGPFTGVPVANAGQNDTSCTLTYNLNATLSHGTGTWTGPANVSFTPNATTLTATATSTIAGTYTLTWTGTSSPGCTDVSTVDITFLNPISSVVVTDCLDSSITVTISNGLPEQNGSNYTLANLLPATANFTTSVATHAGDVVAQGLQNSDMYSFDITDDFGCTTSITGGPFVGKPTANAGQNDTSCTLTYNLSAIPSIGTGTWTGPANVSFSPNANTPNAIATSTVTGTYSLTWTEVNTPGCTDAQSINITFTQMSIPNTITDVSCNGDNDGQVVVAPQGGIAPYSYSWSTSSNSTPVESNLIAGNVTITVTDGNNCTLDSTFTLTQPAAFGLNISNVIPVSCKSGNDGGATVSVTDAVNTYSYSWNTSPVQNTAIASNLVAGTYTVIATQVSSGCTATDNVLILEPDSVAITSISGAVTICSGQSTTITATATGGSGAGYVYTWDNGLGVGQSHTVTPGAGTTTTYQVTAVDGNGCPSNSATVAVTVHPDLTIIASADQALCPGASTTITATPNFGNGGPYSYTWTPNTTISSTTTQSPTVTPITNTTYTVTLSDGCSPTVSDQVIVNLHPLPIPKAESDTLSLCIQPSQPITFYNTTDTLGGMLNPSSVIWDFGDGITSTNPWDTITHTYTQPGTYLVSMTASTMPSMGGCTVTQTVIPTINIYDLPVADFVSSPNPTSMFEPEVQFADQSGSTIAAWHWDFAGLDTSNYSYPLYSFPNDTNGVYPVKLTITDNHGCIDTITKLVTITGEYGIYIPNAFTPDYDLKNDWFGPQGFGISPESYHFMIFDRWGEKMFDTNVLFAPWDGFYKGTRVQEGVYVWKLFFKDINNKKHELIGHVTIIQ